MKEVKSLMELSELFEELKRKFQTDDLAKIYIEGGSEQIEHGLKYLSKLSSVFTESMKQSGCFMDVTNAVVNFSRFDMMMFVLSMPGGISKVAKAGTSALNEENMHLAHKATEKVISLLDDEYARRILETLVSLSVTMGISIAIDEGYSTEKKL